MKTTPMTPQEKKEFKAFDLFDLTEDYDEEFSPQINVLETATQFVVNVNLPGFTEDEVKAAIIEDNLILEGRNRARTDDTCTYESANTSFYRTIPLSNEIDRSSLMTRFSEGKLEVTVDKKN